jgi:hypothetical protein
MHKIHAHAANKAPSGTKYLDPPTPQLNNNLTGLITPPAAHKITPGEKCGLNRLREKSFLEKMQKSNRAGNDS